MKYYFEENGCERSVQFFGETELEWNVLFAIFSTDFIRKATDCTTEKYEQSASLKLKVDLCINGEHDMDRMQAGQFALDTVVSSIFDYCLDNCSMDGSIDCIMENFMPDEDEKDVFNEVLTKVFTISVLLAIENCIGVPFFIEEYIESINQ